MKGIIFNILSEMIEEQFGFEMLDAVLTQANATDGGAYTSVETYTDEELFNIVIALSEKTNLDVPTLVKAYGVYLFPHLVKSYPDCIQPGMTLKAFLQSIHDVIHVEVHKLYKDANTPDIAYEDPGQEGLVMLYTSPRKLCALSEGLVQGASDHFQQPIELAHPVCMHQGHPHCRLEITFK